MKKALALLLMLISFLPNQAQESKESDSTDSGIMRFGVSAGYCLSTARIVSPTGANIFGPTFYFEYSYPGKSLLGVTARAFGSFARGKRRVESYPGYIEDYYDSNSGIGVSVAATINPSKYLSFDVGLAYINLVSTAAILSYSGLQTWNNADAYYSEFTGFTGSARFEFIDNSKLESGLRSDVIVSLKSGEIRLNAIQIGLYLGVKL